MGLLVKGRWVDQDYDTESTQGRFFRQPSVFNKWIKSGGPSPFPPEKDRYHLYVSSACPWSHRTTIFRKLKSLENIISLSIVDPLMLENGWEFHDSLGSTVDSVNRKRYLYEIYLKADPAYTGRATVPVLWDKKTRMIVNNESADIIRMFNCEFNDVSGNMEDFYPPALRTEIDKINTLIYENVNNGVYKAGFATTQEAYEEAVESLFETLDWIEVTLSRHPYLAGTQLTEADWRLFVTLIRFDAVYNIHFKCNKKRIADYPCISRYLRRLYHFAGIRETVDFHHIKQHYYKSHRTINPTGIVPVGPQLNLG